MVHLFFIKTFVAVAQTGSFRLAAARNNITQPAVSGHIRILEKTLGCVLFERSTKKILLTADGQIFMTYALQILKLYENAKNEIVEHKNMYSGVIHIISIYTMGLYQLKPMMQHLLKKYPGITINLEYGHHNAVYEAIKKGTADFGLVAYPNPLDGCIIKVFAHEDLVLVQSRKHPLFKKKTIKLEQLNNINFIGFDSQTHTGEAILVYFQQNHIKPCIVKEYENIETIKNAIEVGMGCSILPLSTVSQEIRNKNFDLIRIHGFELKRPLAIIHNKQKVFSKSTRLFYDMINQDIRKRK